MIRFERFYAHNNLRNFSYLIFDDVSGNAWVIDPWEAAPFTEYIRKQGLSLKGILNTHGHFDHVRGNEELVRTFNAPVKDLEAVRKLELDSTSSLEIISSPGHTLDHKAFVWRCAGESPVLYSGDTLFNAGVGNCKNGGDVDLLFETTQRLTSLLPLDTVLQPGHDYLKRNLEFALHVDPDNAVVRERLRQVEEDPLKRAPLTLKEEMETNPFLRTKDKHIFTKLRFLRDNW
jgi:hydroxyacylglutathione hydrolase